IRQPRTTHKRPYSLNSLRLRKPGVGGISPWSVSSRIPPASVPKDQPDLLEFGRCRNGYQNHPRRWESLPVLRTTRLKHSLLSPDHRGRAWGYGQPWQTGVRVAKYPKDNSPEDKESVSMKKPCPESIR